jgi:hypothetical protein
MALGIAEGKVAEWRLEASARLMLCILIETIDFRKRVKYLPDSGVA